ncbi:xylulokinase [Scopulibacillus darangshiensis]|uniref:Xylulokinase n=1 Tax=Scopulibacillus darangshiensis TaxID=442528 RepID=A0A4R2P416_9BACL|nr:FGGY family carbohydrate kinase [Scopulibacillus darangshiensis]TCP29462.1 xylulokinase [Scopulibacillus darangshiensis]
MSRLLSIDVGTTHIKAGLYRFDGTLTHIAREKTPYQKDEQGYPVIDPAHLWQNVAGLIKELLRNNDDITIAAIGVASMAETGVFVDRKTGKEKTAFIPWFSQCSTREAAWIEQQTDPFEQFVTTGLHNSYKYGLPKMLWLKGRDSQIDNGAVWLSAADYIVYKLTGEEVTDYTLAARTYAFQIYEKRWHTKLLSHFGVNVSPFPRTLPSGELAGLTKDWHAKLGLSKGIPVAVAGHDHVCAAMAIGAVTPGKVYASSGTAETLIGICEKGKLGKKEYQSGLTFGNHLKDGLSFWMGNIPNSGGAIEWIRDILDEKQLTYQSMSALLNELKEIPTGILFFPYLSGSGAPHNNAASKGAFIGLERGHERAHLMKAVLEGTSFQLRTIKETAAFITGQSWKDLIIVGGGTNNVHWMAIKANVLNCMLSVPNVEEATLLGAAMIAGERLGFCKADEIHQNISGDMKVYKPEKTVATDYNNIYLNGYKAIADGTRSLYQNRSGEYGCEDTTQECLYAEPCSGKS